MNKFCRKKSVRVLSFLFALSLAIIAAVFCAQKSAEGNNGNTLKIAIPSDIRSFDIAAAYDRNSNRVMGMIFEGLMRRDNNKILRPAIAESYEVSDDKKHYIFHLRECYWSNGQAVTAQDFEFSWKRSLHPTSRFVTQMPHYFYPIKNAKLALTGAISVDKVPVRALDAKTFSVELEYPAPYFLELLAMPDFFPMPRELVQKSSQWGRNERVVCNGPFKVATWKKNNKIELIKNVDYWDVQNVHLDGIKINVMEDNQTALMMFERGDLDWFGSPFCRISYDMSRAISSRESSGDMVYWFFINTEKYPLNNKILRRALSYAINRREIVDNIFQNYGAPATSALPPSLQLRKGGCFQDGNAALAQKLFEEALEELNMTRKNFPNIELSYIARKNFPSIELSYATFSEMHHTIAQALQDQWRKVLGLSNISLRRSEWAVHFDQITKGCYDLGFMGWSDVLDPSFILELFCIKTDTYNKSNWEHQRYKECLQQAKFVFDPSQRTQLLIEAEDILMEEMPIIPLCFLSDRYAKNPQLQGENLSSLLFVDFKSAYFDKGEVDSQKTKKETNEKP